MEREAIRNKIRAARLEKKLTIADVAQNRRQESIVRRGGVERQSPVDPGRSGEGRQASGFGPRDRPVP